MKHVRKMKKMTVTKAKEGKKIAIYWLAKLYWVPTYTYCINILGIMELKPITATINFKNHSWII